MKSKYQRQSFACPENVDGIQNILIREISHRDTHITRRLYISRSRISIICPLLRKSAGVIKTRHTACTCQITIEQFEEEDSEQLQ